MRALVYANHSLSFEPQYPDPALVEGEALVRARGTIIFRNTRGRIRPPVTGCPLPQLVVL